MKRIAETANMFVFESDEFVIGGDWGANRRVYIGFPKDESADHPLPAVTAVVQWGTFDGPMPSFLDWLETSKYPDDDGPVSLRDEFMGALRRHLPQMFNPEPETVESEDSSLTYRDTADALAEPIDDC